MFRRTPRGNSSLHLDEVHGVRTHAQRAAARIETVRTRALTMGVQVR